MTTTTPYELDHEWRDAICPDLAIEWKGTVVDLSNLVLTSLGIQSTSLTWPGPISSSSRRRKVRKLKRLYPTERMIQSTEQLYPKNLSMKSKKGISHPALLEQHSSFKRRYKNGAKTTHSTRDYQVLSLGPGAYEFIPEDQYENLKPAAKPGFSKSRTSNDSEYVNECYHTHSTSFLDDTASTQGPEYEPIQPTRRKAELRIEISPGVFARLRGSEETWDAIQSGNSTRAKCFSCELSLLCIADAEYVICPACRIISPILIDDDEKEWQPNNRLPQQSNTMGGVGLGMQTF